MNKKNLRMIMPLGYYNIAQIPDNIKGLYGIWYRKNNKCIYVGKAAKQSIKDRLMQEWRASHNERLKRWIKVYGNSMDVCYLQVNDDRIDKMETRLIQKWHPETNIMKKRKE